MKPGHIKQSEHNEKLHEARDTLNNLSMWKSYMKPGHIKQSEYKGSYMKPGLNNEYKESYMARPH